MYDEVSTIESTPLLTGLTDTKKVPVAESVNMLAELDSSLTPLIAKARIENDNDKLDFLERNLKTRVSEKIYRIIKPEDKREPEHLPFLKDKKQRKEFQRAWKSLKKDYANGEFAGQGDFESAIDELYNNYWKSKEVIENNPAEKIKLVSVR